MASSERRPSSNSRLETDEVLEVLSSLIDKSLVVYKEDDCGQGRYYLLESFKQYGQDRLVETGEADAAHQRHQEFFLTLAEHAEPKLNGREEDVWLDRLEAEHDNLRAALGWCTREDKTENEQRQQENAEPGLRLAGALWQFWCTRGHYSEARQWTNRMLELAGPTAAATWRAKALNGAGSLGLAQSDYEAARAFYEQALALARQAGDTKNIADALSGLGSLASLHDDYAAVQARGEECLTLFQELGDLPGIAEALSSLGTAARGRGDDLAAEALNKEALALFRQIGNQTGIAQMQRGMAWAAVSRNDYTQARTLYEQCLFIAQQRRDQIGICSAQTLLSYVAYYQGDYEAAEVYAEESLALSRRMGIQYYAATSLITQGRVALARNDYETARALLTEGLTLSHLLRHPYKIVGALGGFAILAHHENRLGQAACLLGAVISLSQGHSSQLPPAAQEIYDKEIAAVREALGEEAFTAAFTQGQTMTADAAVHYALAEDAEDNP